jgi:hypothetical protein
MVRGQSPQPLVGWVCDSSSNTAALQHPGSRGRALNCVVVASQIKKAIPADCRDRIGIARSVEDVDQETYYFFFFNA